MLDNVTKRRIDTARDILVGKVPDPKSQVEQITIALIYKFMDDMDAQAEEMGGKRSFFSGEYEKYGWAKLMSPGKGGHEVLNLYGEAITTMNQNEGIPPLFRDIFKNAYLPYRDPETLKSFLKIINDFEYDHSERLGDAFEYLLSVLGSQGDAGQFRTPRHIIDFMVEVIDPKKNESILDPACGTAGFLISSWKHVLQTNSKDGRKGAGLTPDERKRLTKNIKGYDISPDMVRLSLVNLYLHGFTDPHISEYDTLTSEDNWNEYSDIIMANPPFMSPKGGIKPHKRFSVQAKRSEVLFVDYIAEHLTPNGRAAVIVPEGIIFQSQNAYKQLRQMLVENYLYAVVSLPAGVFQPYSGVKTSILLMDKTLAKKCGSILFVKIENDGFDLGAQRRQIEKNDLPEAKQALKSFHQACVASDEEAFNAEQFANVLKAKKEKIAENREWNLTGERYAEAKDMVTEYELAPLGEACSRVIKNITPSESSGSVNYIGLENIESNTGSIVGDVVTDYSSIKSTKTVFQNNDVLYGKLRPNLNKVYLSRFDGICSTDILAYRVNDKCIPSYLSYVMRSFHFNAIVLRGIGGAQLPRTNANYLEQIKIPLPPLKIQQKIVAEIEGYQKIIDGARAVVENYKPQIQIDPEWKMVRLGEVMGVNEETIDPSRKYGKDEFVYIDITSVGNGTGVVLFDNKVSGVEAPSRARRKVKNGDVLLSTVRPNLKAFAFLKDAPENAIASTGFAVLSAKDMVVPQFIYYQLFSDNLQNQMIGRMGRGSYPSINQKDVQDLELPLPDLETQKQIVAQIEKEQSLVIANKELVTLFEQKIRDNIASVWGE